MQWFIDRTDTSLSLFRCSTHIYTYYTDISSHPATPAYVPFKSATWIYISSFTQPFHTVLDLRRPKNSGTFTGRIYIGATKQKRWYVVGLADDEVWKPLSSGSR